jgi:hypothetical protein
MKHKQNRSCLWGKTGRKYARRCMPPPPPCFSRAHGKGRMVSSVQSIITGRFKERRPLVGIPTGATFRSRRAANWARSPCDSHNSRTKHAQYTRRFTLVTHRDGRPLRGDGPRRCTTDQQWATVQMSDLPQPDGPRKRYEPEGDGLNARLRLTGNSTTWGGSSINTYHVSQEFVFTAREYNY